MVLTDYCNPCKRRSIESKSVGWCCECEDGLCDKCLQDHKAMKMTQHHHVVKITSQDLVDNYHLLSIPNCELHAEQKEDLLCKDHDVVCCNSCLVTEHKACINVVPIDVAAKGVKSSELFQAIKRSMVENKRVSSGGIEARQAYKEELKRQDQRIKMQIANIKSRFMEHINNLEKSLLSELDAMPKETTAQIEEEKEKIEKIELGIKADESALLFVAENGSEGQMFLFLRKQQKKQFVIKENLEEIIPISGVTITLEEPRHELEAISSLGFLSIRYHAVTKSQEKTNQNGMLVRLGGKEINPHLKIEKEMEIDPKHFMKEELACDDLALFVNDFALTEDNQLLVVGNLVTAKENEVTNYASNAKLAKHNNNMDLVTTRKINKFLSNTQLVKYDVDMNFVKSYSIASSNCFSSDCINSLTCIPKSQQVVISDNALLHFVNSKTMEKMLPSALLSGPNIIDVTANTIHIFALQTHNLQSILIFDLIGRQLNKININNNMNYTAIILQPNDNILCNNNNFMASLRRDGSDLYLYGRNRIDAVTVDRDGKIYMAVEDGIYVMHPHEQQVQRVLNASLDKTNYVVGIEIYKDSSTLFVLQKKGKTNRLFGSSAAYTEHEKKYVASCSYSLQVLNALT